MRIPAKTQRPARPSRTRWFGLAMAAVLLLGSAPALAEDITGSRLVEICQSEAAPDLALCHGFFRGLSDTHSIYAAMDKGLHLYCLPSGVTQEQFERVAFKWMETNSEHLERPAAVLIVQALHEGFPCAEGAQEEGAPGDEAPTAPPEDGDDN